MSARRDLIDATRELLSTQGYEATSPGDIRRASGVGQGSLYHHFTGKADLASTALSELAQDMCAEFDDLTAAASEESTPDDTASADAVAAYLQAQRDPLAGCRIGRICMESSLADERIRGPISSYFEHLRERLTEHFSQRDLPIPAAALADLAIAAVQGSYVTARATGDPSTMRNATSALASLLELATESR